MKKRHIPNLNDLAKELDTDLSDGLSAREARNRLENERKENKGRDLSLFVPSKMPAPYALFVYPGSLFALLLLVLSILTACFGRALLGLSVFAVALAACVFGGIIDLRARRKLERVREYAAPMVRVKRGGNVFFTDGRNVVRGDIILLKAGDLLTCDARIIKCERLAVNELVYQKDSLVRRRVLKNYDTVYSSETDVEAPDAENMLYAGSSIIEGNAVALVVSVGDEVYLSRFVPEGMLGGKDIEPDGVKKLRPAWYKASFLCASGLLILALLGFLTFKGEQSFICYFIMLLSAVYLVTAELLSGGVRVIMSSYISRLSQGRSRRRKKDNTATIRNAKSLETLANVTDILLLGRVGYCEGTFKISGAYASGRVFDSLTPETADGSRLLELIHTYVKAQRESTLDNALQADGVVDALYQHLRDVGFDISGASLALRSVYFANDARIGEGFACAETDRVIYRTSLLHDLKYLSLCDLVRVGGNVEPISSREIARVSEFFRAYEEKCSKCLICISESDGHTVLEGVIALDQPLDAELPRLIPQMSDWGIKTTVLLLEETEQIKRQISNPALSVLFGGKIAYASDFKKCGKDILSGIGEYCAYLGFSVEEYRSLIQGLKKKGCKVATYGVDGRFNEIMACADISVSCDMLRYSSAKYRDSIYERMPSEGRDTNVRASQQTRLLSKVIVKRVHEDGGGVYSLFEAIRTSRDAYISVGQSMLLFVLLMSGLLSFAAVSVMIGTVLLDPLQTVALASVFAFLSITVFTDEEQTDSVLSVKRDHSIYPYELIRSRLPDVIARAGVAALTAFVIKILDTAGVFGEDPTYTLPIFICLLFSLFAEVFFINRSHVRKGAGRSHCWLKVVVAYAILLGVCAVSTQVGFAEEFYPDGFGSFEYLIIPGYIALYFIGILISHIFKKRRK